MTGAARGTICGWVAALLGLLASVALAGPGAASDLTAVEKLAAETLALETAQQDEADRLSATNDRLLTRYEQRLREIEAQTLYNEALQRAIAAREAEIASLKAGTEEIARLQVDLQPVLFELIDTLEAFVRLDLPFRAEERLAEIDGLRTLIAVGEVPLSGQFEAVMAVYRQERRYGQTTELYRDLVDQGPRQIEVDVLRIGRLALYRRSADGSIVQYYASPGEGWKALPRRWRGDLARAMAMVARDRASELVALPLPEGRVSQDGATGVLP